MSAWPLCAWQQRSAIDYLLWLLIKFVKIDLQESYWKCSNIDLPALPTRNPTMQDSGSNYELSSKCNVKGVHLMESVKTERSF